jgi:glycosyltransferase involved in cell wall biosynthesis
LRIAIFTELFAPSIGGQEAFFEGLGRALIRRGHEVEVFAIGHADDLPAAERISGIPVHRRPITGDYKKPRFAWGKRNWPAIFRYALETRRIAREGRHDFYLLNQWPLLHAVALPRKARSRAMLHWCEIRDGRFYRLVQRLLPRLVRFNAAISDSVGTAITAASGRPVVTLPSGLDRALYRSLPQAERAGILSIGRIAAHKNLEMLIEAFESLRGNGYAGRLVLAGDGPERAALAARVAASPARDAIDMPGLVDDEEKLRLLASAELFAMPSRREGFPRVVAEAMASGLPVVTSDYPENGTRDIVARYGNGVVVTPGAAALAVGLEAARQRWAELSQRGLAEAAHLDWDGIAAIFEAHIQARP